MDKLTVHIVDDDEALRDSMEAIVGAAGFKCATYGSAREFLAGQLAPGCALVDVRMPGMDGLALMQEMAARGLAIVMISSELPEILGMSDRIAVMRNGTLAMIEAFTDANQTLNGRKATLTDLSWRNSNHAS